VQTYRYNLSDEQRTRVKQLLKILQHHSITAEVRRELFGMASAAPTKKVVDDVMSDDD